MPTTTSRDLAVRHHLALAQDTASTGGRGSPNAWSPASDSENWAFPQGVGTKAATGTELTWTVGTSGTTGLFTLGTLTVQDIEDTVRAKYSATSDKIGLVLRYVDTNNYYYFHINSSTNTVTITRVVGGTQTTVASAAFTPTSGTFYRLKFRAVGTNATFLYGKVWAASGSEPTNWTTNGADSSSALQVAGQFGLRAVVGVANDIVTFDSFVAYDASVANRDLAARIRIQGQPSRDLSLRALIGTARDLVTRLRVQGNPARNLAARIRIGTARDLVIRALLAAARDLSLRTRVQGQASRDLAVRVKTQGSRARDLSTRARTQGQASRDLSLRAIILAITSTPGVRDLACRIRIAPNANQGALLFPLPAPSGPALPGAVLPIERPAAAYRVGGMALPDGPTVCTAPVVFGTTIPVGSVFTLQWNNPSSATQSVLANGLIVSLTFAIYPGLMVTGPVQIASTLTGSVFLVTCTVLSPIPLSVSKVVTQFH